MISDIFLTARILNRGFPVARLSTKDTQSQEENLPFGIGTREPNHNY